MNINRLAAVMLVLFALGCSLVTRPFTATKDTPAVPATAQPPASALPAPTRTLEARPSAKVTTAPGASPVAGVTPAAQVAAPLYVPPACKGKPVATLPPATTIAQPTPSIGVNATLSPSDQLSVFDALASKVHEVYLYPDFNGLDWNATVAKYRAQIQKGMDTEAFYQAMAQFVTDLGDEHSHFESPAEVAASNAELAGTNDYVGIGVEVEPLPKKGLVTILAIFPNSVASHIGLKPHDSILAVDGLPLGVNGQSYEYLVRGPECSAAVLTVQSPGGAPHPLTVIRDRVTASLPIDAELVPAKGGSRIGYIFLPTFFDETIPGQVRQALQSFGRLDGLILDNRMNGGGSSDVVEPILSYFTSGTLGRFISRTASRPLTVDADPVENSQSVPLVVLVGQDTASFGEIFAGILQDGGRAKVVGQQTLGHVEALSGYDFKDGSRVWIAQESFDPAHSHVNWEKKGITPDVVAFADWDTFTLATDPGVAAALKLLGH